MHILTVRGTDVSHPRAAGVTGRDWEKRDRGTLDDPLGGYALTLVDSLDMLATLGDFDRCVVGHAYTRKAVCERESTEWLNVRFWRAQVL